MKYASVCSGVEAASLAWMPLGWEAAWFSEIEPFPCAVLKERYGHTLIKWKGKPAEECPDSPRCKACGNSMCVNVMRWIGMRIELAERKMK